jgi:general secretion pathway protein C
LAQNRFDAVSARAPAAVATEVNPFRRSAATAVRSGQAIADAPATTLNLILVGVRATSAQGDGSAIIQTPDNIQRVYRVGDVIADGATLAAVESSRVVIMRNGAPESVAFTDRKRLIDDPGAAAQATTSGTKSGQLTTAAPRGGAAPALGAQPAISAPGTTTVSARALLEQISPTPRPGGGGVVVAPRGDGYAFTAAGLEPGDVILTVNGVSLDRPEAWTSSLAGVGPGARLVIEAERAGRPMTLELVLE